MIAFVLALLLPPAEDLRESSVGLPRRIDQLVIEGPPVVVKPLGVASPVVVRIVEDWPHGDARRYDLEYYGLEPGEYDLRDFLQHEDGSALSSIEPLRVSILSQLPPGQVEPERLGIEGTTPLGGYRTLLGIGAVLWVVAGFVLFFVGRKRRADAAAIAAGRPATLAERLRPMVESAVAGRLDQRQRSELEMTLVDYWRRKLGYEQMEPVAVLRELKGHAEAGPLIRGLEDWLHRPDPPQEVDVSALLKPYERVEDPAARPEPAAPGT